MELECCVTNINNSLYKNIVFRKFFQIIFFYEDMKRIDIYTATILGGSKGTDESTNYFNFNSEIDDKFKIIFNYNIKNIKDEDVRIENQDCTESFFKQVDKAKLMWGEETEEVKIQGEIEEKLKRVLEHYKSYQSCENHSKCDSCDKKDDCENEQLCNKPQHCNDCKRFELKKLDTLKTESDSYLFVGEEGKRNSIGLAIKGNVEIDGKQVIINCLREIHRGVDVFSWIHTSIQFTKPQKFDMFKYKIKFPESEKTWTPDFTLYIGPPQGFIINRESSMAKMDEGNHVRDTFQEVGCRPDLYFKEWNDTCNIMNKSMHRILKEKFFSDNILDKKELVLEVFFKDVEGKERVQFIFGIVISTMLAFGIDYTRTGGIRECFLQRLFLPDTQWIITCILVLGVIWRGCLHKETAKESKKWYQKIHTCVGWIGLGIIGLWTVGTFVIYQAYHENYLPWLNWINGIKKDIPWFMSMFPTILIVGWILCIVYIIISFTALRGDYVTQKFTKRMKL